MDWHQPKASDRLFVFIEDDAFGCLVVAMEEEEGRSVLSCTCDMESGQLRDAALGLVTWLLQTLDRAI
jgi:hypothetical protein